MSGEKKRSYVISELILRKLSQIILKEIRDPRLPKLLTISDVKVSNDLSHARVYFTALNADPALVEHILNRAASYLRSALGRTSKWRTVPQLHFVYDQSVEYADRLNRLIDQANANHHGNSSDES